MSANRQTLQISIIDYIYQHAQQEGHRTLIPQYLKEASPFAIANLYHYFTLRDDSQEETEEMTVAASSQ